MLEVEPFDPELWLSLAHALAGRGQTADSEGSLRRALYLQRDLPLVHYELGVIAAKNGDDVAAHRWFDNVSRILDETLRRSTVVGAPGLDAERLAAMVEVQRSRLEERV